MHQSWDVGFKKPKTKLLGLPNSHARRTKLGVWKALLDNSRLPDVLTLRCWCSLLKFVPVLEWWTDYLQEDFIVPKANSTVGWQLHIWYHSLPVYKEFPAWGHNGLTLSKCEGASSQKSSSWLEWCNQNTVGGQNNNGIFTHLQILCAESYKTQCI